MTVGVKYPPEGGGWKKHPANPVLRGPELGACFDVCVLKKDCRVFDDGRAILVVSLI